MRGSLPSRITALEIRHKPKPPEQWEYSSAYWRHQARNHRKLRPIFEDLVCKALEGRHIEFNVEFNRELGQLFDMPDLWEQAAIEKEDRQLRPPFDSKEQERLDRDVMHRWCISQGIDLNLRHEIVMEQAHAIVTKDFLALNTLRAKYGLEPLEMCEMKEWKVSWDEYVESEGG